MFGLKLLQVDAKPSSRVNEAISYLAKTTAYDIYFREWYIFIHFSPCPLLFLNIVRAKEGHLFRKLTPTRPLKPTSIMFLNMTSNQNFCDKIREKKEQSLIFGIGINYFVTYSGICSLFYWLTVINLWYLIWNRVSFYPIFRK